MTLTNIKKQPVSNENSDVIKRQAGKIVKSSVVTTGICHAIQVVFYLGCYLMQIKLLFVVTFDRNFINFTRKKLFVVFRIQTVNYKLKK